MEECTVCANNTFLYPLDCSHSFCMSCIKQICENNNRKCPGCTKKISKKYNKTLVNSPEKIKEIGLQSILKELEQDYQWLWLYKGRNVGWWLFDLAEQSLIEDSYQRGEAELPLMISGNEIVLKFGQMIQESHHSHSIRDLKRISVSDINGILIKGISGMK
jgi:hypothetical protein